MHLLPILSVHGDRSAGPRQRPVHQTLSQPPAGESTPERGLVAQCLVEAATRDRAGQHRQGALPPCDGQEGGQDPDRWERRCLPPGVPMGGGWQERGQGDERVDGGLNKAVTRFDLGFGHSESPDHPTSNSMSITETASHTSSGTTHFNVWNVSFDRPGFLAAVSRRSKQLRLSVPGTRLQ